MSDGPVVDLSGQTGIDLVIDLTDRHHEQLDQAEEVRDLCEEARSDLRDLEDDLASVKRRLIVATAVLAGIDSDGS